MVEVVAGIIVRDGRILLEQRPADKDFPFTWNVPGGGVDKDESHHDALRRELREELGIRTPLIANTAAWSSELVSDVARPERRRILFLIYRVTMFMGDPVPQEGQGLGWFTEEEMRKLTLAPGNQRALEAICRSAFGREAA
jgi:mutator protein MutT